MMYLKNWLSFIKDDVLLKHVVMPGSHNSATYSMTNIARCQDGTLAEQFAFGVRVFDIRTKIIKDKSYISHNLTGLPLEDIMVDLKNIIDNICNEFIIIDLREYRLRDCRPQFAEMMEKKKKGGVYDVDCLIEKYLNPKNNALVDFDINTLTMGDIRKSNKKFILLNAHKSYNYSVDTHFDSPWALALHGKTIKQFIENKTQCIKEIEPNGFFGLQAQLTPHPVAEIGFRNPDTLERKFKPHFKDWMNELAKNPAILKKLNIISTNFMTTGTYKSSEIINFNLLKGNVKEDMIEKFKELVIATGLV